MKFIRSLALCTLGFLSGWLANEWLSPKVAPNTGSSPYQEPTLVERESAHSPDSSATEKKPPTSEDSLISQEVAPGSEEGRDREEAMLKQASHSVDEFKALIESGNYEQAVILYARHRHLNDVEALLRNELRNSLRAYGISGQTDRFTGLADAWLTSYYGDAEILLLVAKQHRAMDYLQEALNVLQLAITYSEGSEKKASHRALQEFIRDTDSELSRDSDWSRLQGFYETLGSMGLDSAEDRVRLAEIYLFHGNESRGRELLLQLSGDSQIGERAQSVLQRYEADASEFKPLKDRKKQFVSRISMKRMGDHYLLPLVSQRGEKVELLLDTGASSTLMTQEAFHRITRASPKVYLGPRVFNTANGLSIGHTYRIRRLNFGPFELESLEVAVSEVDFGSEFDGLLGMNVLQQFTFQIDQENSELLLNRR